MRVAQRPRLASGDAANLAHEFLVPRARDSELRRKTRGLRVEQTANAFVGEIRGNAEARLLDEEALHFVNRARVERVRQVVLRIGEIVVPAGVAVRLLLNVADAVL